MKNQPSKSAKNFRILDLFCGAGGFSCGFNSLQNFKTIIGVDNDAQALKTFEKNFNEAIALNGDITNNDFKVEIIKLSKMQKINMIIGGPPCQGFSLKGKNKGLDDHRNFLFKEFIEIVKNINPEIFVIENVKNIISSCNGFFINAILNNFKNTEYIINYGVLNANDFGIPQSRERAFIIGCKNKCINLPNVVKNKVTVRDAISDLSYLNSGEGNYCSEYVNEANSKYQMKMRKKSKMLYNHESTNHSKLALMKLSMIPPECDKSYLPKKFYGKQKFSTTWSRLIWDTHSPTIDTRFDTPSNGRNSHPFLQRSITPREAARIQSFPDKFVFCGNKCSICKQIGNAVPPLLAKEIAISINKVFESNNLKSDNYELLLGDSILKFKELELQKLKFDSIITDPPYNISKKNNFGTLNSKRKGIDFGEWDINFNVTSWISLYSQLLNKDGSVIIFCSYLFLSHIIDELKKSDIDVKDIIIWKKKNPMPRNTERRYVQDLEFAIWGVKKGSKWVFNKPKNVPYLKSTFESSIVSGSEKTQHPTQKKLEIMEQIIKIHTTEGQIIIDPFMGSGTTGVAAIKNKRRFLGIEISKDYFEIAKKRLKLKK